MPDLSRDRIQTGVSIDAESRVNSTLVSGPLSTTAPRAQVGAVGEDALASLREDVDGVVVRCVALERLLMDASKVPSDSNDTRDLSTAVRDVRYACQHLLGVLGGEMPSSSPIDGTRKRVLVVDDVADATDIVAVILENAGFEVVTATNGLEGLLAAHRSRPTLILMDLQMPVLDGIETTRLLKAAAVTREIPVIAHTARPDSCHVPPGILFADVLPKPVIPDVLLALIQRFVRD